MSNNLNNINLIRPRGLTNLNNAFILSRSHISISSNNSIITENANNTNINENREIPLRNHDYSITLSRNHSTLNSNNAILLDSNNNTNNNISNNNTNNNISNNNSYYSQDNENIIVHKLDDLLININNFIIKNGINSNKEDEDRNNLDDEEKLEKNEINKSIDLYTKNSSFYESFEKIHNYIIKVNLTNDENILDIYDDILEEIKNLYISLKIKIKSRKYRDKFPNSFYSIFKNNNLEYYSQILNYSLANASSITLNNEKYIFTKDLIDKGNKLYVSYLLLVEIVEKNSLYIYKIKEDIINFLMEFDQHYISYEKRLMVEIIFIENIIKKFIIEIIDIEKEMKTFENKYGLIGHSIFSNSSNKKEYNKIRENFVNKLNILNEKYNIDGQGRTDLDINILDKAENVLITVTEIQSPALRKLANKVLEVFNNIRILFNNYSKNLELLDPELVNNQDLIDCLLLWEQAWVKGKKYLCDKIYYKKLLNFNRIINLIVEKYKDQNIKKLLEQKDPEIFIIIPSILFLDAIDRHDNGIIEEFVPDLNNNKIFINIKAQVHKVYQQIKDKNKSYNSFEALILFQHFKNDEFFLKSHKKLKEILNDTEINDFLRDINILSMNIQRNKPIDWNEFIELAFNIKT